MREELVGVAAREPRSWRTCARALAIVSIAFAACSRGADLSGKTVDEIVATLRAGSVADRENAVAALAAVGIGGGPGLFEALGDPEPAVREAAEAAVVALGTQGQGLAASSAGSLDPRVRAGAMRAFAVTSTPLATAESALKAGLADDYPLVRAAAARGIGAYGPSARVLVPSLTDLARRDVLEVQVGAGRALWEITRSSEGALPPLLRGLADESPTVRLSAIEGLVEMRGEAYDASQKLLTLANTDPEETVREAAGKAASAVKR